MNFKSFDRHRYLRRTPLEGCLYKKDYATHSGITLKKMAERTFKILQCLRYNIFTFYHFFRFYV